MTDTKPTREADPYFRELGAGESVTTAPAVTTQPADFAAADLDSHALSTPPNPFVRPALWTGGGLFLGLLGWQTWRGLEALLAIHWSLGALGAGLVATTLTLAGAALIRFVANGRDLRRMRAIRRRAELLQRERGYGRALAWVRELRSLYEGKPQERLLVAQLDQLPDYENDAEVLRRVSEGPIERLDQQAHKIIWRYSRTTGLMVGLSPFALLDVGLALWRSLRMIDEIARIYGIRPSALGRWRLLRLVAGQLAFVGATEMATDAVGNLASGALYAGLSLRLGQGLGAGLYTARIGLAAMDICRPLPLQQDRQSMVNQLADSLRLSLQQREPRQ